MVRVTQIDKGHNFLYILNKIVIQNHTSQNNTFLSHLFNHIIRIVQEKYKIYKIVKNSNEFSSQIENQQGLRVVCDVGKVFCWRQIGMTLQERNLRKL